MRTTACAGEGERLAVGEGDGAERGQLRDERQAVLASHLRVPFVRVACGGESRELLFGASQGVDLASGGLALGAEVQQLLEHLDLEECPRVPGRAALLDRSDSQ